MQLPRQPRSTRRSEPVPRQRAVSPAAAWEIEVELDPAGTGPQAHVSVSGAAGRAVHRLDSWEHLQRVARAHGLEPEETTWSARAWTWCLRHWGSPEPAQAGVPAER